MGRRKRRIVFVIGVAMLAGDGEGGVRVRRARARERIGWCIRD
jgi:hypothetical protein